MTKNQKTVSKKLKTGEEKAAGLNNKEPATAVTRPAVCELWCQISGTGLLPPPLEKLMITAPLRENVALKTHIIQMFMKNTMEQVSYLIK